MTRFQNGTCSCADCDDACPAPPNFETGDGNSEVVPGLDLTAFIMIIAFVVGSAIFLATVLAEYCIRKNAHLCK